MLDSSTGRAVLKVLTDVNDELGTTVLIVTLAALPGVSAAERRVVRFRLRQQRFVL